MILDPAVFGIRIAVHVDQVHALLLFDELRRVVELLLRGAGHCVDRNELALFERLLRQQRVVRLGV